MLGQPDVDGGGGGGGNNVTVAAALPETPSLVAVIVAPPATTPVTMPLDDTAATSELLLAHEIERPVSTLPFASYAVAANWLDVPVLTLTPVGAMDTEATGAGVGEVGGGVVTVLLTLMSE
jgi:hypothetical protein